jgi:hypothetical protein
MTEPRTLSLPERFATAQALIRCLFAELQTDLGFEPRGHVSVAERRDGSVPPDALRALRPLAGLEALERRTPALESIACPWAAQGRQFRPWPRQSRYETSYGRPSRSPGSTMRQTV